MQPGIGAPTGMGVPTLVLIMKDVGLCLIFAKVINPNVIKVVAKSLCTIYPLNQCDCIVNWLV